MTFLPVASVTADFANISVSKRHHGVFRIEPVRLQSKSRSRGTWLIGKAVRSDGHGDASGDDYAVRARANGSG
jgi:hypothetical protein